MIIRYLFSHPDGDIPLHPNLAESRFRISPNEQHPFLRIGDYFKSIEKYIFRNKAVILSTIAENVSSAKPGPDPDFNDIDEVSIRSEKHGAFYHVASLEIFTNHTRFKFALNTALSQRARQWLEHEFGVITSLNNRLNLPYLPEAYHLGHVDAGNKGQSEHLTMALMEWFEDFHEWHIVLDESNPPDQTICLWDQNGGNRTLSEQYQFELFRQASKILTLYYDMETGHRISSWHHAAGDFIVQTDNGKINVKLTTARRYEPFIRINGGEKVNPIIGLIYFFLDLTIRMRLDKADGVGETVWVNDFIPEAVIKGFFDALTQEEKEGKRGPLSIADLLCLLRNFSEEELKTLLKPLMNSYDGEDKKDCDLIQYHMDHHIQTLHQCIRRMTV